MVRVQVVRDIGIDARPGLECLELGFGLRHVAVEVVEVAQTLGFEAGVCVGWVVAFVVLDVDEDAMLFGGCEEGLVVLEGLDGGLGDQDVDLALDCVEGYGVVGCVWGKDGDSVAGGEGVDCGLVGEGVASVVGGVGGEGCVEAVVEVGDVFGEMFACLYLISIELSLSRSLPLSLSLSLHLSPLRCH